MFDQVMDTFRKATESTLQAQQQMLQQWTQMWPGMSPMWPRMPVAGVSGPGAAWLEQVQAFQKQFAGTVTDLLKKHRDTLETQYTAGIRTISEAFRVGEAKDPAQLQKLTEELWKQNFECLRTISESQIKEFQLAIEKWFETVSKGSAAMKG